LLCGLSRKSIATNVRGAVEEYMLRRLKRPQGARDLPGGGGEVKELRATMEQ